MSFLTDPRRRVLVTSCTMGLVWCSIMLGRLFLGNSVGLADNFDGHRLMCQLDVTRQPLPEGQPLWAWVTPTYDAYDYKGEACSSGGSGKPYLSTQWLLLIWAKYLTPVLGLPGALDLRALGVVCAVVFGLAIALLTAVMPLKVWVRVIVVSAIGLATVDSAIAPYFVSPLSEPAALLGMLFLLAAMLRMLRRNKTTMVDLLLVTAAALWTIFAKTQTVTLLIGVLPAMLIRPVHFPWISAVWRKSRNRPAHRADAATRHRGPRRVFVGLLRRLPAGAMCAVVAVGTLWFSGTQAAWLKEIYHVHQVFLTILPNSPDPEKDLEALGVDPSMAQYSGKTIIDSSGAVSSPHYQHFIETVDDAQVIKFWATHPVRALKLADEGLEALTAARPGYLGNYLESSGEPAYAKDNRFILGGMAFTLLKPIRWIAFPGLWLGSLGLGAWLACHRRLGAAPRGIGLVLVTMSLNTMGQFGAVLLSDGQNDIVKHMILVVYSTFLLVPLLIAAIGAIDRIGTADQLAPDQVTPTTFVPWPWRRGRAEKRRGRADKQVARRSAS
ncbi:hypothetical protein ACH429_05000 [Streptomyces pathocidini]|uniref:Glycosyltransferase RgtA/B/C/D-like domain-containing protein n=1 Tax=Streptomyces pathocidini TaxID=1650571 RepID=A0ABW7ULF5_9ACTN|nr:hypothetical protein [Streptomyces pathocidini]